MFAKYRTRIIPVDAARAGSEEHVLRYILAISLGMSLTVQSVIWISASV